MIEKEFVRSDIEALGFNDCDSYPLNDFLELLNHESLGRMVAIAIDKRKQGHFNDSVRMIAEINKKQVFAIREIQIILDRLRGQERTTIVIDKFRQTFPFQIGLTCGDQVLDLLDRFNSVSSRQLPFITEELYQKESECNALSEEYHFMNDRMKGRIPEEELEKLEKDLCCLSEQVFSIKLKILDGLVHFISEQNLTSDKHVMLKLIQHLYAILTSSIETLDAKLVEV